MSNLSRFGDIDILHLSCPTLVNRFWQLEADAGRQRQLFIDFAHENPNAFSCFAEILAHSSSAVLRALAIQGFGEIPESNLPDLQGEDFKYFLKLLFAEVSSSSDIVRLSAAKVVTDIIPPFFIESRNLWEPSEPLDRIELSRVIRKLEGDYLKRVQDFNLSKRGTRGDEPDYERYLDFWVYGATSAPILFTNNSNSENYRPIVEHVLNRLQGHGVILALGCQGGYKTSQVAQDAGLHQARVTYSISDDYQKLLYDDLVWYIQESSHSDQLRVHAAETINLTGEWKPTLEKLKVLSKLLLGSEVLRDGAIQILSPQMNLLQQSLTNAAGLLRSFINLQQYRLDDRYDLRIVSLQELEKFIRSAEDNLSSIKDNVTTGINTAKSLGKKLNSDSDQAHKYLHSLDSKYTNQIKQWLIKLRDTIKTLSENQQKIKSIQNTLNHVYDQVKRFHETIYSKLTDISNQTEIRQSTKYQTLEECDILLKKLNDLYQQVYRILQSPGVLTSSDQPDKLRKRAKVSIIWGIAVATVAFFSPLVKVLLQDYPIPQPIWFEEMEREFKRWIGSYSISRTQTSTSDSSKVWYLTGFPKPNGCGSSSSASGEWYRVLVTYSDANWQGVLNNHCGDIGLAQSRQGAKQSGKIQVASFGNRKDAEGFADYMKDQYGSGWVEDF